MAYDAKRDRIYHVHWRLEWRESPEDQWALIAEYGRGNLALRDFESQHEGHYRLIAVSSTSVVVEER